MFVTNYPDTFSSVIRKSFYKFVQHPHTSTNHTADIPLHSDTAISASTGPTMQVCTPHDVFIVSYILSVLMYCLDLCTICSMGQMCNKLLLLLNTNTNKQKHSPEH